MFYVVLDLEFNQFFPFASGQKMSLNPACPFEIIQIGAVKLDEDFNFIGSFNAFVKPNVYRRIHPFVEKITGISMKKVKDSPDFPSVYKNFSAFTGNSGSILCTWGVDDIKSLFRNIYFYDLDASAVTDKYINVQKYASQHFNNEPGAAIGLKNAATQLELPMDEAFHDALNDARYTAEIFKAVCAGKEIAYETFDFMDTVKSKKYVKRVNYGELTQHFENLLNRKLTVEEKALVKSAYKLGQAQSFDAAARKPSKTNKPL